MKDSIKKALDALEALLEAEHEGFRLEAAREILKYAASTGQG